MTKSNIVCTVNIIQHNNGELTVEKIKIGFVGVGAMGQCAHLKNYAVLPDCEVAAIAELREELGHKVATRYGVPHVYKNHEEMLAKEKLDGIVASQPFTRHGTLIPELLKAGIPIFTEKPIAGSIECGEIILAALEKTNTWHMVGYHKRSDPATMYAKAEIDRLKRTEELGKMHYVRITMPPGDWVAGGFEDMIKSNDPIPKLEEDPMPRDMDDNTYKKYLEFVNYYIHQINLMRYLLGEPYRVDYADPSEVLLVVRSESGITGTIEMSPYQTTTDWHESALVAFEHGYIKLKLPAPLAINRPGQVEIFKDPGGSKPETISPTLPWVHAMRQQAINFISAIKGETKPPCEAAEAVEDLKIARDYIRMLTGK